jgi:two-component system phosphate regulon sensor histidine kinase PhoR
MRLQHIYAWAAGIGVLLALLVVIQIGWLSRVRAMEQRDTDMRIHRALEQTAKELEQHINCFEGYSKAYVNADEPLYVLHTVKDTQRHTSRTDTLSIVYNPSGLFPDTVIMMDQVTRFSFPVLAEIQFNFHVPMTDSAQRRLRQSGIMDTVKARTYRDLILNKLSIASLINTGGVDSLLQHNLLLQHLDASHYGYGFINADGNTELARRVGDTVAMRKSAYAVMLFQGNSFLSPHKLSLVFPRMPGGYGFAWWLLLSIGIIMVLSIGFLLFVRLHLRQRRLSEMKSDFINNLTHEFNTPMANIALAIETMNGNGAQDPKTARILNIISSESYRLRENIERTLQVATLEQGRLELRKERVDLVALINTVLTGYTSQCEQLGGSISFRHEGDTVICGDEVHLLNCLCNLLDNAIRYRSGAPRIGISLQAAAQELLLQITDCGIGMSAETQRHIFEQFYRAHQGDLHNTKGFGLGLSYVKGIVMLHGGRISVRSKPGVGSTFIIHLPRTLYVSNGDKAATAVS